MQRIMSIKSTTLLFALVLLLNIACEQEDGPRIIPDSVVTNTSCLTAYHHEYTIGGMEFHFRYNNPIFPGYDDFTVFDTMIIGEADGSVCVNNLPVGKHWCVAVGYDPVVQDSVRGSLSFFTEHLKDGVDSIIYVTEVH